MTDAELSDSNEREHAKPSRDTEPTRGFEFDREVAEVLERNASLAAPRLPRIDRKLPASSKHRPLVVIHHRGVAIDGEFLDGATYDLSELAAGKLTITLSNFDVHVNLTVQQQ